MAESRLTTASSSYQEQFVSAPQRGADFYIKKDNSSKSVLTPIDGLTGLPLPVLARGTDFYLPYSGSRKQNYHHHFHPAKSPRLGHDGAGLKLPKSDPNRIEGLALRYSWGQELPVWLHHRYHEVFSGPELPDDSRQKFTRVVLACAGVVPTSALNLYEPEEYSEVALNHRQHEFIRRQIYFEGAASKTKNSKRRHIGKYIAEYSLSNSLTEVVNQKEINRRAKEFLRPKSEIQKVEAGRFILSQVVGASVNDLIEVHNEAIREGMVKKTKKSLGQVMLKFFTVDRFQDYFGPLEERLQTVF